MENPFIHRDDLMRIADRMRTDMYGHLIHVSDRGKGGFGISLTFSGHGRENPEFTFFHESDDFQQAMFTISFEERQDLNGKKYMYPKVVSNFEDRLGQVLELMASQDESECHG